MHPKRILRTALTMILLLGLFLGACAPQAEPTEQVTLKIAVLPILDTLPMYVAAEEGLFAARGINVEFVPVASAPERDQVVVAEQVDGTVNEVLSAMFFNQDEVQVQIVRIARAATPKAPVFHILASAQSGITTVEGLKGATIGISKGTVIEYLTDRLLEAQGFRPDEINTTAVSKIPDRLALLNSGELQAAVLPDPLSFLAIQQGAVDVLDDSSLPEVGYSVITFRKKVIDETPEAIRAFLVAIEEAVELINTDPEKWENLLTDKQLVPAPLVASYQINPYPRASVPSEAQWKDALDWAKSKGLLQTDVSYTASVNSTFLP